MDIDQIIFNLSMIHFQHFLAFFGPSANNQQTHGRSDLESGFK